MVTKLFVLLASLLLSGSATNKLQSPFTVTGVIQDKATGSPVQYVHVFTVKGEEEAVTDAKGGFRFQTWQQSADLTTEKEGYHGTITRLHLPAPKQTILLTKEKAVSGK